MRTITYGDVRAAACYLMQVPAELHRSRMQAILDRAHLADRYRKRFRRPHPIWGDGTLWAAVPGTPAARAEPVMGDEAYLDAMLSALEAILHWKRRIGRGGAYTWP